MHGLKKRFRLSIPSLLRQQQQQRHFHEDKAFTGGEFNLWAAVVEEPQAHDYAPLAPPTLSDEDVKQRLASLEEQNQKSDFVDPAAYVSLLKQAGDVTALKTIQAHISHSKRFSGDRLLLNCVVEAYGKCGCVKDARLVFSSIRHPNVYSWTILLAAYAQNGHHKTVLELLRQMDLLGVWPNAVTLATVIGAVSELGDWDEARKIHARAAATCQLTYDVVLVTALIDMYAKCGDIFHAEVVFDQARNKDLACCNAMISAYIQLGYTVDAVSTFNRIQPSGLQPNQVTYALLFRACATNGVYSDARVAHMCFILSKLRPDVVVNTALVSMYSRCGSLEDARRVFDRMPGKNVVTWNVMIAGYAQEGYTDEALQLYVSMEAAGVEPDEITFVNVLESCSLAEHLAAGRDIHKHVVDAGYDSSLTVLSALITMYSACGSLGDAVDVFHKGVTTHSSVISWTAMLTALTRNGEGRSALALFRKMDLEGVKANVVTFVSTIDACSSIGALVEGHAIFERVIVTGYLIDVVLGTSLINLYGKCGRLDYALEVFHHLSFKNIVTWNTILAASSQNGEETLSAELLQEMDLDGAQPNEMTLLNMLFGCSHNGLVAKAVSYFRSMVYGHCLVPTSEHYGCLVDLLGRSGQLEEVEAFISSKPFSLDSVLWMSLLGSCVIHSDVERGLRAARRVLGLDPKNASPYVLLSNMFAAIGMLDAVKSLAKLAGERAMKKEQSRSYIEVNGVVHEFGVRAGLHRLGEKIGAQLREWSEEMEEAGFVPLHDVRGYHDEKLAIAFGAISSPPGVPLFVVKNLRMCVCCHGEIKHICKMTGRDISVREGNRVHHFRPMDASCSCGDYW
ncbi:hypothetical protein SELMODRAFT_135370 [Selaginella moellendorffii]|uniref:DYW domain-containing protein n=1 Tax=Selaginella moellendorffii TaxID=88036 RepID=D8TAA5_SELML|nr:pentatricopeptide repeat-containing protein At3g12770 [Selaginella moellendorffii]XP_024521905.1 pentatricopeptide repeat-containing protein At3g12770 [Selaginella moellendorffii]EFJ06468.1 hypothetical protein SELMODRAFT_135370 [Selaginella moellendorffii]|eukprot:XP_002992530.1 pentatricopeptide repeat-containing protein At3g12770 [Selaginella moellendorffii]